MYTDRNVTRVLQPVAFCVALILVALPGADVVCQWVCAGKVTAAAEHSTHHQHHSGAASETAPADGASLAGTEHACDHLGPSVTAVVTAPLNVMAPVGVIASQPEYLVSPMARAAAGDRSTHSPPGIRFLPLPLRI